MATIAEKIKTDSEYQERKKDEYLTLQFLIADILNKLHMTDEDGKIYAKYYAQIARYLLNKEREIDDLLNQNEEIK